MAGNRQDLKPDTRLSLQAILNKEDQSPTGSPSRDLTSPHPPQPPSSLSVHPDIPTAGGQEAGKTLQPPSKSSTNLTPRSPYKKGSPYKKRSPSRTSSPLSSVNTPARTPTPDARHLHPESNTTRASPSGVSSRPSIVDDSIKMGPGYKSTLMDLEFHKSIFSHYIVDLTSTENASAQAGLTSIENAARESAQAGLTSSGKEYRTKIGEDEWDEGVSLLYKISGLNKTIAEMTKTKPAITTEEDVVEWLAAKVERVAGQDNYETDVKIIRAVNKRFLEEYPEEDGIQFTSPDGQQSRQHPPLSVPVVQILRPSSPPVSQRKEGDGSHPRFIRAPVSRKKEGGGLQAMHPSQRAAPSHTSSTGSTPQPSSTLTDKQDSFCEIVASLRCKNDHSDAFKSEIKEASEILHQIFVEMNVPIIPEDYVMSWAKRKQLHIDNRILRRVNDNHHRQHNKYAISFNDQQSQEDKSLLTTNVTPGRRRRRGDPEPNAFNTESILPPSAYDTHDRTHSEAVSAEHKFITYAQKMTGRYREKKNMTNYYPEFVDKLHDFIEQRTEKIIYQQEMCGWGVDIELMGLLSNKYETKYRNVVMHFNPITRSTKKMSDAEISALEPSELRAHFKATVQDRTELSRYSAQQNTETVKVLHRIIVNEGEEADVTAKLVMQWAGIDNVLDEEKKTQNQIAFVKEIIHLNNKTYLEKSAQVKITHKSYYPLQVKKFSNTEIDYCDLPILKQHFSLICNYMSTRPTFGSQAHSNEACAILNQIIKKIKNEQDIEHRPEFNEQFVRDLIKGFGTYERDNDESYKKLSSYTKTLIRKFRKDFPEHQISQLES